MAHVHTHGHEEGKSYLVEQVSTIGVCGALGGVAILLYAGGLLFLLLHPNFHLPLLIAGIALLVLAAIQAVAVWFAVKPGAHPHDHDHAHCHGHTHLLPVAHHHGHDHGWGPWRYAVLLLPIMLYFLNLPNAGFASLPAGENVPDLGPVDPVVERGLAEGVGFKELEYALADPALRDYFSGKTVILRGQFRPGGVDDKFTLVRFKSNCCPADAIALNVVVVIDSSSAHKKDRLNAKELFNKWLVVKGQVQFLQPRWRNNSGEWMAVILVRPTDKDGEHLGDLVKQIPPEKRPFIF